LIYSGGTYSFASAQEYYSGTWNGGDCWGWCQLDPTVLTSYTGDYSTTVDPCQQVAPAGTWRVPTQTELQNLITSGSVWTTKNGVNGRYFGTTNATTANASPNNYVFLPAAGYRSGGITTMFNAGVYGNYWSTTSVYPNSAYFLDFSGTFIDASNGLRNYGFAVRCVK